MLTFVLLINTDNSMAINCKKISSVLLVIFSFFSCDSIDKSVIPDSPVYIERNIHSEALELRTIGGYKTFIEIDQYGDAIGFGGILVQYGYDEVYYAFDMACPHEVDRNVRVFPNENGQAVCSTCGSVFSIGYGSGNRLSGPVKEGLRRYRVSISETVAGTIFRVSR